MKTKIFFSTIIAIFICCVDNISAINLCSSNYINIKLNYKCDPERIFFDQNNHELYCTKWTSHSLKTIILYNHPSIALSPITKDYQYFMSEDKAEKDNTIGMGFSYAISNSYYLEMHYLKNVNNFKIGFSIQLSNAKGEIVENRLSNYGLTLGSNGQYFSTFDFGYGRIFFNKKIMLDGEISIGKNYHYQNYLDNRFTSGGYHMISKSENILGCGLNIGYFVTKGFNVFVGYNTIRKFQFGARLFLKLK
jgi:hypothetical protein